MSSNKAGGTSSGPSPVFSSLSPTAFDSLLQANAKAAEIWMQSWSRLAGESVGFLSRRWKQDLDLMEKIRACKTPLELLQLQSDFMQRALADYMREAGSLAKIETDASLSEIEALDEGVREACEPGKTKAAE